MKRITILGRQYFTGMLQLPPQKNISSIKVKFQNYRDCVCVLCGPYLFWLLNRVLFLSYFTFSSQSEYSLKPSFLMIPDPTHLTYMAPSVVQDLSTSSFFHVAFRTAKFSLVRSSCILFVPYLFLGVSSSCLLNFSFYSISK